MGCVLASMSLKIIILVNLMVMIKKVFIPVLLVLIIFSGCNYIDALNEDGELITREISVEAFDRVEIETSVRLVLSNDTVVRVRARGLDFILDRLNISQNGTTLIVEAEGNIGFRQKQMPDVIIAAPNTIRITSNFPSEISTLDTLIIDNLTIVVNGRGTFTECHMLLDAGQVSLNVYGSNVGNHIFQGKAEKLNVVAEGLTSVNASELIANEVKYIQRSVNDAYLRAREKLSVEIYSSGNVYYYGNPDTTVKRDYPLYEVELGNAIPLN